jgi:hypothetical protein
MDDGDALPPLPTISKPMVKDNKLMKNYFAKGDRGSASDAPSNIICNLTFDVKAGKEIVDQIQQRDKKIYE